MFLFVGGIFACCGMWHAAVVMVILYLVFEV